MSSPAGSSRAGAGRKVAPGIEAKENVSVQKESRTAASITSKIIFVCMKSSWHDRYSQDQQTEFSKYMDWM